MTIRDFDLNIEEVLENWEVEHAIRENIANALDEQVISKTAEIEITKDLQGDWHIRDHGRGLRIEHFTLNENKEKLESPTGVIGKFGVGLKDALATFHRREIGVVIRSSFGTYRLKQEHKHGFNNIVTLHIEYDDSPIDIRGTEFVLSGVADADMAKAKSLFLKFAGEETLETDVYGQILRRKGNTARVYILGVFANEEPNFLFSYNITSLTESMKKKLNRERLNVGRATYADRVKAILKNTKSKTVEALLLEQVEKRATGDQCDEMGWIEISQMALNLMHQQRKVAYLTEQELQTMPNILDSVRSDGFQVVVVTDQQKAKLESQVLEGGPQVRTVATYVQEYNASFQYQFVDINNLTGEERAIFNFTPKILALVGLAGKQIPDIRISETMRVTSDDTEGVWDSSIPAIVVRRNKLSSLVGYAATLLHEVGHATTGAVDATRAFESVLTDYLGKTTVVAINNGLRQNPLAQRGELPTVFDGLSLEAKRLAREMPPEWKPQLFAQIVSDEIAKYSNLRSDHKSGLNRSPGESPSDIMLWNQMRFEEASALGEKMGQLMNHELDKTLHHGRVEDDPTAIVLIARKVGEIYEQSIKWSLRTRGAFVENDAYKLLLNELGRILDDFITLLENLGPEILRKIKIALESPKDSPSRKVNMQLDIRFSNWDAYTNALKAAIQIYNAPVELT